MEPFRRASRLKHFRATLLRTLRSLHRVDIDFSMYANSFKGSKSGLAYQDFKKKVARNSVRAIDKIKSKCGVEFLTR